MQSILTVTVPSPTIDLTVVATVKIELGLTDSKQDARLALWIRQASAVIASYCNRVFGKETLQEEFWPSRHPYPYKVFNGISLLQLTRWPIVSVTSVTENGVALVDGTDYRVVYDKGQLLRLDSNLYPRPWYPTTGSIVVQYIAGYDLLATLPVDIGRACITLVKILYFSADRDPKLMSDSIAGIGDSRWWVASGAQAGALPPEVADLVDNYRVPVVA